MDIENRFPCKRLITVIAFEWPLARMDEHVSLERRRMGENCLADETFDFLTRSENLEILTLCSSC